jgi:septum formation protein
MSASADAPDPPRLVLASASPRRRLLLSAIGIAAEVRPADIDEDAVGEGLDPRRAAVAVAVAKAEALDHDGRPTLAADTMVSVGGSVLGKPSDRVDAQRMLHMMSGRTIEIVTGLALRVDPRTTLTSSAASTVAVHHLGADRVRAYLESGEADDKAGALAIQGGAAEFVTIVDGTRSNTVGLPLAETIALLARAGIEVDRNATPIW